MTLGFTLALVLSLHTILAPLIPIQDGLGYAMRGFSLYGYLHTGQWKNLGELLSRPEQSICPLHYLLFFMLPSPIAGFAGYVIAQNFTTYLLLAYAVSKFTQVLNRPEWAPVILLLCGVNNVALSDLFAFYLDMQFLALGLLVIAWQMEAWRENQARVSLLIGLGLGALFWIKPANALIFLATFILSELLHAIRVLYSAQVKPNGVQPMLNLVRRWGTQCLFFLPLLGVGLFCGGAQTILSLIDSNEVHASAMPVACTGLIRLLYFPLCLSFFYHALLIGGLLLVAFAVGRCLPIVGSNREGTESFPSHLFIPIALSYLVLGEVFSFWMLSKTMRSLLLMLPLIWVAVLWLGEKRNLRADVMFLVAAIYASTAFLQKSANLLGSRDPLPDVTYQLSISSWTEMPSPWFGGFSLYQSICDRVKHDLPSAGIICVNSAQLQRSLTWRLVAADLLSGKPPAYEVRNLFNYKGDYDDQALIGSHLIILITYPPAPSNTTWRESIDLLDYGSREWRPHEGLAQISEISSPQGQPMGYELFLSQPLTQPQVALANQSEPFTEMTKAPIVNRHPLSLPEARQLLKTWIQKRIQP